MKLSLEQLAAHAKGLYKDKLRHMPLLQHERTRDRLTASRLKDLATHVRHAANTLGFSGPEQVDATALTEENLERVRRHLVGLGRKAGVVNNTLTSLRLLRDLAIELGVSVEVLPKLVKPKRGKIYRREGDRMVKIARAQFVSNNAPYKLPVARWPETVKVVYAAEIEPFYRDEFSEHRNATIYGTKTWNTWCERAARAFGIELALGVPPEGLDFRRLTDVKVLRAHRAFLRARRGFDTDSTRGYLEQWRALALNFYGDVEANKAIRKFMKTITFQKVKNKQDLVERVHADELYHVFDQLFAQARAYEADPGNKHGRAFPKAQVAHHWMAAAVYGFTLMTWLRQENVASATMRHIYKRDGAWHFRFAGHEMKGKRDKADQVIDLWRRDETQERVCYALDKALALRPHLIERFRAQNPGKPDPETFFLNHKGRKYSNSTLRLFFWTATSGYLGPEKAISMHDIRSIVPSWFIVREGREGFDVVQRCLDHASSSTTEKHYVRVERIFGTRLAKLRMEERRKRDAVLASLAKVPEQVAGMLNRFMGDLRISMAETAIDPVMLGRIIHDSVQAALANRPE